MHKVGRLCVFVSLCSFSRRLSLLLLLLTLCVTVPAQNNRRQSRQTQQSQSSQRNQLERQRSHLREKQKQARQRQEELEREMRRRLKDVEVLASDIENKQLVLDSLYLVIDSVNTNIAVLDSQLTVLKDELEERRQHYISSVRYMYRNRNAQSQLIFVLSAENLDQMYRRLRFMKEYTTHQRAQGEAVKQKGEQVAMKLDELNVARDELNVLLAQNEAEQSQMEQKKAEQQHLVDEMQQEQKTLDKLISQQKREEADLTAKIDKLIAEELERQRRAEEERQRRLAEQRRREQEQAAANVNTASNNNRRNRRNNTTTPSRPSTPNRPSTPSTPSSPNYRDSDPDRQLTGSFRSNKGRLPVPITGSYRVVRPFGNYVIGGVTLNSSGVHLEGQAGAQARCVFNGEVSKVYNSGQNGYVIMVRHGRYISVYSNLSSVSVTAGQRVTTNQILGTVGPSHILMFRLQDWDQLLNPKKWISRL